MENKNDGESNGRVRERGCVCLECMEDIADEANCNSSEEETDYQDEDDDIDLIEDEEANEIYQIPGTGIITCTEGSRYC
jgi:hypothetical protein